MTGVRREVAVVLAVQAAATALVVGRFATVACLLARPLPTTLAEHPPDSAPVVTSG